MVEKKADASVIDRFKDGLFQLQPSPLTDTLQSFWEKSKDVEEFKKSISFWYDDYMDRVSGWFKIDQRWKLRILGFAVAIALNVDSLHLVKIISLDDKLRNNLVGTAEKVANQYQSLSDTAKNNTSALIKVFTQSMPDSLLTDSAKINHLAKVLKEKDPKKLNEAVKLLKLNDSLSTVYMYKADSVLGIAAGLNIPIGCCRFTPHWTTTTTVSTRSRGIGSGQASKLGTCSSMERR